MGLLLCTADLLKEAGVLASRGRASASSPHATWTHYACFPKDKEDTNSGLVSVAEDFYPNPSRRVVPSTELGDRCKKLLISTREALAVAPLIITL